MDRDPALIKKRRIVMGIWDMVIAVAHMFVGLITGVIAISVVQVFSPQGIEILLTALTVVFVTSGAAFRWISKINRELKSDISTGQRFISGPHKELPEAYTEVDEQITAHWRKMKEEYPIVFISSLSYYPTYMRRRHVVAASVVMTLRR